MKRIPTQKVLYQMSKGRQLDKSNIRPKIYSPSFDLTCGYIYSPYGHIYSPSFDLTSGCPIKI